MSPESDQWIGRGRFVPTTPWEAVWNGVGQWLGVHGGADLDWALPNRHNFNECEDLFTDKDLFSDGACTCSICEDTTWLPTGSPVKVPTQAPSLAPQPTTASPTTSTLPLQDIGNNGSPAGVYPLGQCQGDCDDNGECQVCFATK
jgi:hypothetical protein